MPGASAQWSAVMLPHGHPASSPFHNGSAVDVAVLVDAFSTLGGNAAGVVMLLILVLLPLYLLGVEVAAVRRGERVGAAMVAILSDLSHLVMDPLAPARRQPLLEEHDHVGDGAVDDEDRWKHGLQRRCRMTGRSDCATPPKPVPVTPAPVHGVQHLAVIMDGNRRYGKEIMGSSLRGHEAGGNKLMEFIVWCADRDIDMLTVYAFSTENWNRPAVEISVLMGLFRRFFERIRRESKEHGIRIRYIVSDVDRLPTDIVELMRRVERETANHTRIVVNVCVSYSSRRSLTTANQRLFAAGVEPTDDSIRRELARSLEDARTAPLTACNQEVAMESGRTLDLACDPDALLRTSREQRLSNFMLLELAYTEFFFVDELWPAVSERTIDALLDSFAGGRQRRFGA